VVPPLLTVLTPTELPLVEVSVPPVVVPSRIVIVTQPTALYVPPVYLPKQDRN
jgi:hypothetical protein